MYIKIGDGYVHTHGNTDIYSLYKPCLPKNPIFYINHKSVIDKIKNIKPYGLEELIHSGNNISYGSDLNVDINKDNLFFSNVGGKLKYLNDSSIKDIVLAFSFKFENRFEKQNTLFRFTSGGTIFSSNNELSCAARYDSNSADLIFKIMDLSIPINLVNRRYNVIIILDSTNRSLYLYVNNSLCYFNEDISLDIDFNKYFSIGGNLDDDFGDIHYGFNQPLYNFFIGEYSNYWKLDDKPNTDYIGLVMNNNCSFNFDDVGTTEPIPLSMVGTTENGTIKFGTLDFQGIIER